MATIAELVTYQLRQTENDLLSDADLGYDTIKAGMVERAMVELYSPSSVPTESAIPDIVRYYLADAACIYLIDVAVDWYKTKARRMDIKEGANIQYYDRVETLEGLRRRLELRAREAWAKVRALVTGVSEALAAAGLPRAQAQAEGRSKVTLDPFTHGRYLYGDYLQLVESAEPYPLSSDRPGPEEMR